MLVRLAFYLLVRHGQQRFRKSWNQTKNKKLWKPRGKQKQTTSGLHARARPFQLLAQHDRISHAHDHRLCCLCSCCICNNIQPGRSRASVFNFIWRIDRRCGGMFCSIFMFYHRHWYDTNQHGRVRSQAPVLLRMSTKRLNYNWRLCIRQRINAASWKSEGKKTKTTLLSVIVLMSVRSTYWRSSCQNQLLRTVFKRAQISCLLLASFHLFFPHTTLLLQYSPPLYIIYNPKKKIP